MTREQMLARITALEAQLQAQQPQPRRKTGERKAAKDAARARKRQFRLDQWRRAHRHTSLNRYTIPL